MYIKNFNRYIKESLENKSPGEKLQFELRDFNSKKNNLKNLIMNNIDNDKDISKNYEDIVKDNPFLSTYGNILKLEALIESKQNKIKEIEADINKLRNDDILLDRLSDENEKTQQKSNIDDQIKEKMDMGTEEQNSIKDIQEKIKVMQEGLKEFIMEKTQEIRDIEKNAFVNNIK